jgi:hypothetical protein
MIALSFAFSASQSATWVADQDYFLVGVSNSQAVGAYVGANATISVTEAILPTAKYQENDVYFAGAAAAAATPMVQLKTQMNIPILAGSTLFVGAAGATRIIVYLEPVNSAE